MAILSDMPLRSRADLRRFEAALTLEERLPERSVYDVFAASAARHPDRTALTMLMSGTADERPRCVSYRELLELVRRAANLFFRLGGVRPGVAYLLPNFIETHAVLWGAETAGYAVPVNYMLQPASIVELIRASRASLLVALGAERGSGSDLWQKALAVRAQLPALKLLRLAPPDSSSEGQVDADELDFHAELMAQPEDHLVFGGAGAGDETAAFFHTGGTTGAPKLVPHTHRGQLVAALGGVVLRDLRASDVVNGSLPLFHSGGTIMGSLCPFMAGAHVLLMSPAGLRNPAMVAAFWRIAAHYRLSWACGVPTSFAAVLEVPIEDADLSALRGGSTGAATLPSAVGERFRELTGRTLYQGYGMTEAAGLIAVESSSAEGGGASVGWPLPYTDVRVRRLEPDGRLGPVCAAREIGAVTVRGPTVSRGYLNPAQDAGTFEGGMLNTGDLGYTDEQGRLYITGRSKDLIIRAGHNIDPAMIENALSMHPAVALAAAVGMPDAHAGEVPVCYVSLRPGAQTSDSELHEHARRTVAERPAWPRHILIVEAMPLTEVGKIYKPRLRLDATARRVTQLIQSEMALPEARVRVSEGGLRGIRVSVTLPAVYGAAVSSVEQALAAYLFESDVTVA
ncbi:MAG TPA: AMP-binding protein [Steroidobacteraceae bacterium]|nr:AMP-binding protein [Steroidobacteraceae bacterium]